MAFIAGELDGLTVQRQVAVHEHLAQAAVDSEMIVVDGLGHSYPNNLSGVVEQMLASVLDRQDADSPT